MTAGCLFYFLLGKYSLSILDTTEGGLVLDFNLFTFFDALEFCEILLTSNFDGSWTCLEGKESS